MTPDSQLQAELLNAIWQAIDRLPMVQSATVAGSFASASPLEAVSDIDLIVIADPLNVATFSEISGTLTDSLRVPLDRRGWELLVNSSLGPLKFDRPRRAVLHLMLYSPEAHRQHVLNSPFTCLDWQRSPLWRKAPLADVYPCFGLQPRHFLSKRRSVADYLHDLADESVSYRELEFTADGYREIPRRQPMAERDRVEFAWHIVRFVLQNFVKLVRRTNEALAGDALLDAYLELFPAERNEVAGLFRELAARRTNHVAHSAGELVARVRQFLASFERQFRDAFETRASRHYFLRHAPTALNGRAGGERLFLGRTDAPLDTSAAAELAEFVSLPELAPGVNAFSSPLMRTRQTLDLLGRHWPLPKDSVTVDARLLEIDYGHCEGLTVAEANRQFPELFDAWRQGEDSCFPGGECTADVAKRLESFLGEHITAKSASSVVCTHNVVLRCLVGELLGVPRHAWHRLAIGHVEPIEVVATEQFGRFVNLTPAVEESIFAPFAGASAMLPPKGLQIVVPMAGDGARFRAAGYELPKPLIPVDGVPMVVRAVADLPPAERVVLVVRRDHDRQFHVCDTLRQHLPHADFVLIDGLTAGQACTVRLAGPLLNSDQPVLVAACDNTHVYDADQFAAAAQGEAIDVLIWTYRHDRRVLGNPRQFGWVLAEAARVLRVSCKRPISDNVLADPVISGCFYFRSAGQLLAAIDKLVERDERVNGEFYLDCVPNVLIDSGSRVDLFEVDRYIGWGTPEELADYLRGAKSTALATTA